MKFLSFKDGLRLLFSVSAAHAEMIPEGYDKRDVALAGFAGCHYSHSGKEIQINSLFASATLGFVEDKSKDEAIRLAAQEMLSFDKKLYWTLHAHSNEMVLCETPALKVFEGEVYTGELTINKEGRFLITFDQPETSRGKIDNGLVSFWLNSLIFR